MTKEDFKAQVETMIINLEALKAASGTSSASAYAFDQHDYPLAVCECAAILSGNDITFAKMFNRNFRRYACSMMFERALMAVDA